MLILDLHCRVIMQAFIMALDLDYSSIFTCERCDLENMIVIIDGKEMGIRHIMSKAYETPVAADAALVPIESWVMSAVGSALPTCSVACTSKCGVCECNL